jgi:hypothetical protein
MLSAWKTLLSRLGLGRDLRPGRYELDHQVLIKFGLHSKSELRLPLQRWDFAAWGKFPHN